MGHTAESAARSEQLAADVMGAVLAHIAAGRMREADELIVHAYHDGARPRDILREYDVQRGVTSWR